MRPVGRRAVLVGLGAFVVLAGAGLIAQQVDAQRYATTVAQHHIWGWVAMFAAAGILGLAAVLTALVGRGGDAQLGLLVGVVAPVVVAWEAAPAGVRMIALAAGPWTPLLAIGAARPLARVATPHRLGLVAAGASVVASGLLLLAFQPFRAADCFAICVPNPWALTHLTVAATTSTLIAALVGVGLGTRFVRDVVRSGSGPTSIVGALAAAASAIVLPVVSGVLVGSGPLWVAAAISLGGLSAALVVQAMTALTRRRRVRALVTVLSAAPEPEELTAALTRVLGAPVVITYPDSAGRGFLDGAGQRVPAPGGERLEVTSRGAVVAVVGGPGVRDAETALGTGDPALPLLVENASVVAGLRAQVALVRAARAAVVTANDQARAGLEHDLHDGAQQLVLALALDLRLLADACGQDTPGREAALRARDEVVEALRELRAVAHGLHPAALSQGGLLAAVELLVEQTGIEVTVDGPADLPPEIQLAAYRLVERAAEETARRGGTRVDVTLRGRADRVVIELGGVDSEPLDPGLEEDRVLALGGELHRGPPLRAELPISPMIS